MEKNRMRQIIVAVQDEKKNMIVYNDMYEPIIIPLYIIRALYGCPTPEDECGPSCEAFPCPIDPRRQAPRIKKSENELKVTPL